MEGAHSFEFDDWYFLLAQGHWTRTTEIYTVIVKLFQFAEGAGNYHFFNHLTESINNK